MTPHQIQSKQLSAFVVAMCLAIIVGVLAAMALAEVVNGG